MINGASLFEGAITIDMQERMNATIDFRDAVKVRLGDFNRTDRFIGYLSCQVTRSCMNEV